MEEREDKSAVVATGSGIVVGAGKSHKYVWRFAGLIVLVVVVSLALGVGVRMLQDRPKTLPAKKVDPVAESTEKAQSLSVSGDYDQANTELEQTLKKPNLTTAQKFALYFQQGVNYENQQNYTASLAAYKQADALDQTEGVAHSIARVAAAMGDKATAIAYYQKAITRIPADSPLRSEDKAQYQQSIKDLEAQQ